MFLNNVGIFVKDLEKAKTFFEDYFGARVWKEFNSPEQNYYSYVLEFDGQARLELMSKPGIVDQPKDPNRSGLAPVCFAVQSREQRDASMKKAEASYEWPGNLLDAFRTMVDLSE